MSPRHPGQLSLATPPWVGEVSTSDGYRYQLTVLQFEVRLSDTVVFNLATHSIFGHIRRLPESTTAHKALKLVMNSRSGDAPHDNWNRPAGRPRTSWMSQIVRDTGLTAADAWAVADDRSTWRALRPTAGYAQHWLTDDYSLLVACDYDRYELTVIIIIIIHL